MRQGDVDYRTPHVPLDGLVRLFTALERRSGWAARATSTGLLLRRRFDPWPLIAALGLASAAAVVALVLVTVPGAWSRVGRVCAWAVCALALLGGALTVRRASWAIDVVGRTLRGRGASGPIEAPWGDVRAVELVRRPREAKRGTATMTWRVGEASHPVLELDGASATDLTRAKGLALGLAALFGASCVERSTDAARAALAASDRRAGLEVGDRGDPSSLERMREVGATVGATATSAVDAAVTFLEVLERL